MKSLFIQLFTLILTAVSAVSIFAQTTAFTYQGKLTDLGNAANGQYQVEFKLFDAPSGGSQIGSTISDVDINAIQGIFTTQLDFGSPAFAAGQDLFIEISVRRNSGESYVGLSPRQRVTSAPYAVKALLADSATTAQNSNQLGGVNASEYVLTNNPALTDARDPLPGSTNYIQNTTTTQPLSNFNISGEGKADVLSAASHFSIGAARVLKADGASNTFAGFGTGQSNTTGGGNSFFGLDAGRSNTTGVNNTFFGIVAGRQTTTGSWNSFFGPEAGRNNNANANSFFGSAAGLTNTTGGVQCLLRGRRRSLKYDGRR